jgi:hypothetical protein
MNTEQAIARLMGEDLWVWCADSENGSCDGDPDGYGDGYVGLSGDGHGFGFVSYDYGTGYGYGSGIGHGIGSGSGAGRSIYYGRAGGNGSSRKSLTQ